MKVLTSFFAVAVLAIFGSSAMAAHLANPNLLGDGGVEGTLTFDGPPFVGSWEGFSGGVGASAAFTTSMPRNGAQAMELNIANDGFAGAFQDATFPLTAAGANSWFSGWHKSLGNVVGTEIRIEWRNSVSNTEISRTANLMVPLGSTYEEFVVAAAVPVGVDTARVVYAIADGAPGLGQQQVFADDFNFNVAGVPEPTSLALAGLAGLALVGQRRRKR